MSADPAGGPATTATASARGTRTAAARAAIPATRRGAAGAARRAGANVRGMSEHLARYLDLLDLRPGATIDEINASYFMVIAKFPANPTEEEEARMQELKRAYDILRRAYVPPARKSFDSLLDRRKVIPLLGMATIALAGFLVYLNRGTIKLKMTHYRPGAVLRLHNAAVPFGTVVGYEAAHTFPAGAPGAAYEVRLEGRTDTVWVSERLVVNGMAPISK